ncbi:MAG: hypothetical protein IKU94_00615 [Bacteroidaceae bacterium]|nr:hypothetical protein [Bacteroidaceae bacterium]MBR4930461.1 hypothetical protein [Bacteroidaceae bacterium]
MRYCGQTQKLCDRLIISEAVTFADNTLTINLPAGSYGNGCKYCIVVAQAIPAGTTINAPVVVTIGDGTVEYPLTNQCCSQLTACSIRTRTKYPVVVATSPSGGTFKVVGKVACAPNNNLSAINGTATEGGAGA